MLKLNVEKKSSYWLMYTIAFCAFSLIIFSSFILKRNSLVRSADGFDQTYPVLVYIGQYLRDLLQNGQIKQYDFRLGFGESVITSISWLGFGDIFTLLSVFVPKEYTEYLFDFIVLLKIYLSGVTFSFYCFFHNKNKKNILVGALLYVFSRFALIMGPEFYQFLNPMVWLPLLFLGIDKILASEKNRISFSFVLTVFIQAVNGFYFLYMESALCVVYFVIRYFTMPEHKNGLRDFVLKVVRVSWQYILGLSMGAVIFIPAVIGYFNSTKTNMNVPSLKEYFLYTPEEYIRFFQGLLIPEAWVNNGLGLPFIIILFIVMIFGRNYKNKCLKGTVIFFICAYLTPLTGSVLNGFSYSSDRWYFVLYFFAAYLYVDMMEQWLIPERRQLTVVFFICIFSMVIYVISHPMEMGVLIQLILFGIMFAATIIAVYFRKSGKVLFFTNIKAENLLIIVTCINILLSGFMLNAPVRFGGGGYSGGFSQHGELYDAINRSQAAELENGSDFGRIDVHDTSRGASLVLNYNGTSEYFSIINKNISEFFMEMAISPGIMSAANALEGLDSRTVLEALLSVEYIQDSRQNYKGELINYTEKNPYKLPFGFTYNSYMSRDVFDELNELEKMDALMTAVVVEEQIWDFNETKEIKKSEELPVDIEYMNIKKNDGIIEVNEDSIIKISCDKILDSREGELYVKINNMKMNDTLTSDINVGNKKIQIRDYNSVYYIGKDDYLIHVNIPENNEIIITFSKSGRFEIGSIQVYWYPLDLFKYQFSQLEKNVLNNVQIGNNQIAGEISLEENKIMFLSIPYDSAWKAEVDGVEVPLYKANVGFVGIPLEKGDHKINLEYTTPGIGVGAIVSMIALLTFIILLILNRKMRNNYYGKN